MCDNNPRPIEWRKESDSFSHGATKKSNNSSTTSQEETSLSCAGFSLSEFGLGRENPAKLKRPVDDVFEQILTKVENSASNQQFEQTTEMELEVFGEQAGVYTEEDLESARNESYIQGVIDGESKVRDLLIQERERLSDLANKLEKVLAEPKLSLDSEFELDAIAFMKKATSALIEGVYDQLSIELLDTHIHKVVKSMGMSGSKVEIKVSPSDFDIITTACSEKFDGIDFKSNDGLDKGDIRIVTRGEDIADVTESELRLLESIKFQIEEA